MTGIPSNVLHVGRVGLALVAGFSTWGLAAAARAADLDAPLLGTAGSDAGAGWADLMNFMGSMLFDAQTPACTGFRAFDLAFLAVVALVVISAIRFRHATAGRRLELARRMVEKGIEPPAELIGANHGSDLRRGLVLVFTGVGLLLASLVASRTGSGASETLSPAGLIPGFIGLGYLVSHRFAVRSNHRSNLGDRS
jgi:hypothetical protein